MQLRAPRKQASPQRSGQASVANKNTLQQTPKEVKGGTYKPCERASELLLERVHLHEFLRTLRILLQQLREPVVLNERLHAQHERFEVE